MREGILTDTTLATVDPAANRGNVAFFVADPAVLSTEVCAAAVCAFPPATWLSLSCARVLALSVCAVWRKRGARSPTLSLSSPCFMRLSRAPLAPRPRFCALLCCAVLQVAAHGPFNLVVLDDLLTHTVQPLHVVSALSGLVGPGGLVLIASDNDWTATATPRNSWLGGFKMNGDDMPTLAMLRHNLKRHFNFLDAVDVPKVTQTHQRKFEVSILETSAWVRL